MISPSKAPLDQYFRQVSAVYFNIRQNSTCVLSPFRIAETHLTSARKEVLNKGSAFFSLVFFIVAFPLYLRGVNAVDAHGHLFNLWRQSRHHDIDGISVVRSEERRVGEEGRSRG